MLMTLYTAVYYHLKMCTKKDGLKHIKGDNYLSETEVFFVI